VRATFRVRAPIGHLPEQTLEEAGFRVSSCITGRTYATSVGTVAPSRVDGGAPAPA
jgi:hypothetical protein